MTKRGAGWIPDYPDQSDYTLEKDSQKLSKQVQSQGSSASIESLTKKICAALEVLVDKAGGDPREKEQLNNTIRENLKSEISDEVDFITVDFHDIFKAGYVDSEMLRIRIYLSTLNNFYHESFSSMPQTNLVSDINDIDVTNTTLDQEVLTIVQSYLDGQLMYAETVEKRNLKASKKSLSFDDMICLRSMVNAVSGGLDVIEIVKCWSNYLTDKKINEKVFFENLAQRNYGSDKQRYPVYP